MRVLIAFLLLYIYSTMAIYEPVKVANANFQFCKDLWNVFTGKSDFDFSPFGVHSLLSVGWQGAQGTTDEAFAKGLHLTDKKVAAKGYKRLLDSLDNLPDVTLSIINKAYVVETSDVLPEFNETVTKYFGYDVGQFHPTEGSYTSAEKISRWFKKHTHEKIKDIVGNEIMYGRLVLINAVYFKSDWKHPFNKNSTKTIEFKSGSEVYIMELMSQINHFYYKEDSELNADILEMPYKNEDFSMIIILPKIKNDIELLEKKLKNVEWNRITEGLELRRMKVILPKFEIENKNLLKKQLKDLGLEEIFDGNKANFSGINPNEHLYVTNVIQTVFTEINEGGSGAHDYSGDDISDIPVFDASRPFISLIKGAGHILLVGKQALM